MNNKTRLTEIIRDAIKDYSAHTEDKTPSEWLQGYLGAKLPEKTVDEIHKMSNELIAALDVFEQKKAEMNAALEKGQSAENWLTADVMAQAESNAEKARIAAEFLNGISAAEKSYDGTAEVEIIDVEAEDWNDSEWNDYRLKDSLKGVATEAGNAGMHEVASEIFEQAADNGLALAITEDESIPDKLIDACTDGLKVAVSAGIIVAQEKGVIAPVTMSVIAATAYKTVESLSAFKDVVKGKSTITEAVIKVKNTAVSTFSGLWQEYKGEIKEEIPRAVGKVFGPKGAAVAGAVIGMLTPTKNGSRLRNAIKGAAKATWSFLTKERHLSFFNKNKEKQEVNRKKNKQKAKS